MSEKRTDRIKEERTMSNGMKAAIIVYRSSTDIDIQFEDKTIVTHKAYRSFNTGYIKNPNLHKDEERVMNNGQKCKIIAYRKSRDIDVQFEDGTIVTHKFYDAFITGHIRNPNIKNPNYKSIKNKFKERMKETRIMNNGMKATIIDYRNTNDIDVQFEDKTVVTNVSYGSFLRGNIRNPNINKNSNMHKNKEKIMHNGQKCKIIAYRNANDIDVQFEDKTIVTNTFYSSFLKGSIRNPNLHKGETNLMKCGQIAVITDYRRPKDIDIRFEDGTEVKHTNYDRFKAGVIRNPKLLKKNRMKNIER